MNVMKDAWGLRAMEGYGKPGFDKLHVRLPLHEVAFQDSCSSLHRGAVERPAKKARPYQPVEQSHPMRRSGDKKDKL